MQNHYCSSAGECWNFAANLCEGCNKSNEHTLIKPKSRSDIIDALGYSLGLDKLDKKPDNRWDKSGIKDVIFNPPATIVFWDDGIKTVVKARGDDVFDPEKGLAMAIVKRALGNKYDYYNTFEKWTKKYKGNLDIGEAILEGIHDGLKSPIYCSNPFTSITNKDGDTNCQ